MDGYIDCYERKLLLLKLRSLHRSVYQFAAHRIYLWNINNKSYLNISRQLLKKIYSFT